MSTHTLKENFWSHNFLIRQLLRDAIAERAKRYLSGRLLDIGCGTKQYRNILESIVEEHVGLDHAETQHSLFNVDIIGTAYDIPDNDCSFDSVLCTEVLEHLEDPASAIQECHRVLKPNGYALFTSPFIWHLHEEPRDFYRYSKYGLRYLFEESGFEVLEVSPLNGFWATFGQLLAYNLPSYDRPLVRFTVVVPLVGFLIQNIARVLDKLSPRPSWTSHYVSVVKRKE
jgi:SAM-dependent methyltransferase